MPTPRRGEVWLIDFGQAGKTRPAVVVSVAFGDRDRSLVTVVPHTTSLRGSPFEISVRAPFLKPGAFLVQGVATFPIVRALHRLGVLSREPFENVFVGMFNGKLGRPAHGMGYGLLVGIVEDPVAAGMRVSPGSWGWDGAYGTQCWIDPKEKMVSIVMIQTQIVSVQRDFENAVLQAIID